VPERGVESHPATTDATTDGCRSGCRQRSCENADDSPVEGLGPLSSKEQVEASTRAHQQNVMRRPHLPALAGAVDPVIARRCIHGRLPSPLCSLEPVARAPRAPRPRVPRFVHLVNGRPASASRTGDRRYPARPSSDVRFGTTKPLRVKPGRAPRSFHPARNRRKIDRFRSISHRRRECPRSSSRWSSRRSSPRLATSRRA